MINPIQQAIADHRRAFAAATQADAPIEAWRAVDCCAWGLLENGTSQPGRPRRVASLHVCL
jgi:hypothetical protein